MQFFFRWTISCELILGIIGIAASYVYYGSLVRTYGVTWYEVFARVDMPINIWMVFFSWLSVFFVLEYACYTLKRETLTRDLIRGNFLPLISIIGASAICIVFVELFNTPFHIWVFHNWPYQSTQFMSIPIVAYLVWPSQYLLLLPIIRLFDGKNEENVW